MNSTHSNSAGPTQADADVVIIGAGHNGLTAACYLARAGLAVTVIEARQSVGGMTSTHRPFDEAPEHAVNTCAVDMLYLNGSPVVRELDLTGVGYRQIEPDVPYAYAHPDGSSLPMFRSVERTAEEIRRFSRRDADAYIELMRVLDAGLDLALPLMTQTITRPSARSLARVARQAARHLRTLGPFGRLIVEPGLTSILERFESPLVHGLLGGLAGFVNPLAEDATAGNHFLVAGAHRFGVTRPVGGTGALPAALQRRLETSGGRVVLGAAAQEIILEHGRAVAVATQDGVVYRAKRAILASCDPRRTLLELLPGGTLDRVSQVRAEGIPASDFGVGPFKVDIALSGALRLRSPHPTADLRVPTILQGTIEEVRDGFRTAQAGSIPARLPLIAAIPNAVDTSQTPDGQDCLYVYSGTVPVDPAEGWPALRDRVENQLVAQVSELYDGIESLHITRRSLTPDEYATYATRGCILHVDTGLFRAMGPARPAVGMAGYRSPVAGLWLTGIGTHPGGGVSGFPGRNAARELLREFSGHTAAHRSGPFRRNAAKPTRIAIHAEH